MNELLVGFPVIIEIPVAWGEMDAFQHVNNIVYLRYFESSRITYMGRVGWDRTTTPNGVGPILGSVSCRFRYPVTFPDTVSVGARVVRVEKDRFTMEHLVVSQKAGKIAAKGEGVIVSYDYDRETKAVLPAEICNRISALEGNPDLRVLKRDSRG